MTAEGGHTMDNRRILRHLMTGAWQLRRAFPPESLRRIEAAIHAAESRHDGQIRFAVEASLELPALLRRLSARERALEVFSQLRVWDTEHNNGVLIYLLLADRDVEIVADRGVHRQVGNVRWEAICRRMEEAFRQHRFEPGVLAGIEAVGEELARAYPKTGGPGNELADAPVLL